MLSSIALRSQTLKFYQTESSRGRRKARSERMLPKRVKERKKNTAVRPVKFTLSISDMISQVLRKARLLRSKEGYKSVYVCPDRTVEERRVYKKLLQELKLNEKQSLTSSLR